MIRICLNPEIKPNCAYIPGCSYAETKACRFYRVAVRLPPAILGSEGFKSIGKWRRIWSVGMQSLRRRHILNPDLFC